MGKSTLIGVGFRVTPTVIYYAVVAQTGEIFSAVSAETIKCPKAMSPPLQLKHVRQTVFDLLHENKATYGGIKLIEGNSRSHDTFRLNVEGVVQEAFASSSLKGFFFRNHTQSHGGVRLPRQEEDKGYSRRRTGF